MWASGDSGDSFVDISGVELPRIPSLKLGTLCQILAMLWGSDMTPEKWHETFAHLDPSAGRGRDLTVKGEDRNGFMSEGRPAPRKERKPTLLGID